jgi:thioredoxin 1
MNEKPFQTLFKIGIIVLLILIVLVVLNIKNKKPRDIAITDVSRDSSVADNPLSSAFRSGKPVVADFGRGTCVPCKMMEPILKKLQKDYKGRASVLIIDVGEFASLSRKYGVRIIPTQIFFDATGNEVYRHQGFMPEGEIVVQLRNMGVE